MDQKLTFFTKGDLNIVIAARPESGTTIIFNPHDNNWKIAPQDYYQIIFDHTFREISAEKALSLYKNFPPDLTLLDRLDKLMGGKNSNLVKVINL